MGDEYCFVCNRVTDHWGEHDALVEVGLARYRDDGTVLRTDKWDDALAKVIVDAEWEATKKEFGLV